MNKFRDVVTLLALIIAMVSLVVSVHALCKANQSMELTSYAAEATIRVSAAVERHEETIGDMLTFDGAMVETTYGIIEKIAGQEVRWENSLND